jgi:hypothetical protein
MDTAAAICGRVQRAVFQSTELADVLTERYFCSASREIRERGARNVFRAVAVFVEP